MVYFSQYSPIQKVSLSVFSVTKILICSSVICEVHDGNRSFRSMVRSFQSIVKNLPHCTCNYPFYSAYNSLNQRVNFGQFKLCTDIEKNPGPSVYVDATKTINAPYCQGNVTVFGENAGQQCVAMSLCALIYSKIAKITSTDAMTQIMIVGMQ